MCADALVCAREFGMLMLHPHLFLDIIYQLHHLGAILSYRYQRRVADRIPHILKLEAVINHME